MVPVRYYLLSLAVPWLIRVWPAVPLLNRVKSQKQDVHGQLLLLVLDVWEGTRTPVHGGESRRSCDNSDMGQNDDGHGAASSAFRLTHLSYQGSGIQQGRNNVTKPRRREGEFRLGVERKLGAATVDGARCARVAVLSLAMRQAFDVVSRFHKLTVGSPPEKRQN
jgi:hypothetical protein